MAKIVIMVNTNNNQQNVDLAKQNAESSPSFNWRFLKIGTNAMVREPSANSLLSRFGTLKATKKTSAIALVPRKYAITTSRKKPSILLRSVAPAIIEVFFFNLDI